MKNIENKVLPLLSSPSTTEMLCLPQRRLLRRHLCPHPRHLLVLHQSLDYIQETLNYLPQLSIFLRYKPGSSSGKELRKLWQADRTLASISSAFSLASCTINAIICFIYRRAKYIMECHCHTV